MYSIHNSAWEKKWTLFACPFGAFRSGIILISEKMGKS
jgi:hypothetical protein